MRGYGQDEVAFLMGVSVMTVIRLRRELRHQIREAGRLSDPLLITGQTMAFYDNMIQEVMELAHQSQDAGNRNEGIRLALQLERDRQRFLTLTGFYDANRVQPYTEMVAEGVRGEGVNQLTRFLSLILDDECGCRAKHDPP